MADYPPERIAAVAREFGVDEPTAVELIEWNEYWDSLTPAERIEELRMMSEYVGTSDDR